MKRILLITLLVLAGCATAPQPKQHLFDMPDNTQRYACYC